MSAAHPFVEAVGAKTTRRAVWLKALREHNGNITRASAEFGFSKQRGFALAKAHGLVEEARELRRAAGQPTTGRPRLCVAAGNRQKGTRP